VNLLFKQTGISYLHFEGGLQFGILANLALVRLFKIAHISILVSLRNILICRFHMWICNNLERSVLELADNYKVERGIRVAF